MQRLRFVQTSLFFLDLTVERGAGAAGTESHVSEN